MLSKVITFFLQHREVGDDSCFCHFNLEMTEHGMTSHNIAQYTEGKKSSLSL